MLRFAALFFLLLSCASAQAFSQCTSKALAGPGAKVAEEGANPVEWGKYSYAGFSYKNQIGVVTSPDYGKTVGAPVTIVAGDYPATQLRLAASYEHVYAVWAEHIGDTFSLMFDASRDHGFAGSWGKPLSFGPFKPSLTQISADGPNVHIAYLQSDGTVAVLNSTDAGKHFSAPTGIAPGWGEIVIASLNSNVYVAWNTDVNGRFDVSLAVSHDGGATFEVQNISAGRPSSAREPIFALEQKSGRLSLIWREDVPVQGVYLQSLDNGATWSSPVAVDTPARQYMVVDDGKYIYLSYLPDGVVMYGVCQ